MGKQGEEKRKMILDILEENGPLSIKEIHKKIPREIRLLNDSSIRAHCRNMLLEGLVKRTPKVKCKRLVFALPHQDLPSEDQMPDDHRRLFNPFSSTQIKIAKYYR